MELGCKELCGFEIEIILRFLIGSIITYIGIVLDFNYENDL